MPHSKRSWYQHGCWFTLADPAKRSSKNELTVESNTLVGINIMVTRSCCCYCGSGQWFYWGRIFTIWRQIVLGKKGKIRFCTQAADWARKGRQVKPVKVLVQQRYYKLCNLGAVENEDHFLLVCPAYQSVRERFKGSLPLTVITPLAELLSCQQQGILARFLVQCQTIISELLHQT